MKKIPRFATSELKDIAELLSAEGVSFDFEGVTTKVASFGADTEYFIVIDDADFVDVVALLMDYYRIDAGTAEPYAGDCPACGYRVVASLECPDCGLSFAMETPGQIKNHPFYKFLEQNGLLPISAAEPDS